MKGDAEGEIDRRLCALGERFAVPTAGARSLRVLLALLAEDPTAPTTVTDPCEGIDAHLADALVALELPAFRAARTLVDLGAGPGVPGLPLAAALPRARVYLVESVGRKASFLARAVDAMGLGNVEVVWGRVETWAAGRGVCDVVCARALARLDVVVEYAAPLLRDGGQLVAWKGRRDAEEDAAGARAAALLGLEVVEVRRVAPWPRAQDRHLHVLAKTSPTPGGFPRRPGMARKRPLGAEPTPRRPLPRDNGSDRLAG